MGEQRPAGCDQAPNPSKTVGAGFHPRPPTKIESVILLQCGCPECGILMTQVEKGLDSACKCPDCGHVCRACMGREKGAIKPFQKGMSKEEWEAVLALRERNGD
jgi:hypothetical protein